jgi:hypothetical protein
MPRETAIMTALTDDEVIEYLARNGSITGIQTDDRGRPYYDDPEANALQIKFPETPLRATYFARLASMLGAEDESMFYGALLWITLSDIGSPQLEKTGWSMVDMMRRGFGENRPLEAAPGHLFRNGAVVELAAFLIPCFLFAWDAYIFPIRGDLFIHISHNENWAVMTKNTATYETVMNDLKNVDPQSGRQRLLQRFCPQSRHLKETPDE